MNKIAPLFLIILFSISCSTKRKVLEKEKVKTELLQEVETKTEETKELKTDSIVDKKVVTITSEKDEELDIVADSTGVVTVETEITDKGIIKTFTGVKSVSVRDRTKEAKVTDSTSIKLSKQLTEATTSYQLEITKLTQEIKRIKSEKEKTGSCTFFVWGFFILLLLVIAYIVYRIKKKLPV